jgi:hypothetical protein
VRYTTATSPRRESAYSFCIPTPDALPRILLLQRADTDHNLKDLEGYTAYDLYNSTIEGTKPPTSYEDGADLFTWGTNRSVLIPFSAKSYP